MVAVSAIGATFTKIIPVPAVETFFTNLKQVINQVINGQSVQFFPFPESGFVNSVNEAYATLKSIPAVSSINIDLSQYKYAQSYFKEDYDKIVDNYKKINTTLVDIQSLLTQLSTLERDGKLLTIFNYDKIEWSGGSYSQRDWATVDKLLHILEDLGILDKGAFVVLKSDLSGSHYVNFTKVRFEDKYNTIDYWKKIGEILVNYNTIINGIIQMLDALNIRARQIVNAKLVPILSNNNIDVFNPTTNISGVVVVPPTTLPKPAFGQPSELRLDEEDWKRVLQMLIALFGLGLAMKLMSLIRVNTMSVSVTRTINAEATERFKKKEDKRIPRKIKKRLPKTFKYAERNVGRHSEWIEKVSFEFPVAKDYQSNDRGTLIFYLKNGRTIRRVRVARGTFSFIVYAITFVPYGVGYRFWSHFNRKYLVNPNTISIGLRMISNADRIKAIPKELSDKQVIYR